MPLSLFKYEIPTGSRICKIQRPHHLISWLIQGLRSERFCACIQPVGSAAWTDGPCHPYPSHATYCPDLSSSILLYTSALRIRDGQIMFRWLRTSLAPFHRCHLTRIGVGSQARMERAAGRRGLDSSVAWGRREECVKPTLLFLTFSSILPSYLPLLIFLFNFFFLLVYRYLLPFFSHPDNVHHIPMSVLHWVVISWGAK